MKKLIIAFFVLATLVFVYVQTSSQNEAIKSDTNYNTGLGTITENKDNPEVKVVRVSKSHPKTDNNCQSCHYCEVPTIDDPCLRMCPRDPEDPPVGIGPDVVIIDQLMNEYHPVTFSHKAHAEMSGMFGGCENCHHFNTSGPIKKCGECHSESRKRKNINVPDLQAAYHRQCISCHKEWENSSSCNSCHEIKSKDISKIAFKATGHPVVKAPEKLIYKTGGADGKMVTFFHNQHIGLFNIDCASCHKQENCTRCHDENNSKTLSNQLTHLKAKPESERHQQCFSCHANDDCSKCHMNKEAKPFDHAKSTGFALSGNHSGLACQSCHTNNKFQKINSSCQSCHKDFVAGKFDHARTGLKLDDIHAMLECGDCHTTKTFSGAFACENCHDMKYPQNKPGTIVKVSKNK